MARPINSEIVRFILDNVEEHGGEIGPLVAARFGVSRATSSNYLKRLVADGLLSAEGQTRAKTYRLKPLVERSAVTIITPETQDDTVWRQEIRPAMVDVPENIMAICAYGFTEMFNNVLDHSGSDRCMWWYKQDARILELGIHDYGIGIFEKIKNDFALEDHRQALLELSKGKLSSDPSRHSGEGIFFTSRMFDRFHLISQKLSYIREQDDNDQWLTDAREHLYTQGTAVMMRIALDSTRTPKEVFRKYEGDDQGFSKTQVAVHLANYGDDQLVSRSQAKRVMARLDGFLEVVLDFQNVRAIGQGFADEVFRVFRENHPEVHLTYIRANLDVERMISHVLPAAEAVPEQARLL